MPDLKVYCNKDVLNVLKKFWQAVGSMGQPGVKRKEMTLSIYSSLRALTGLAEET